MIDPSSFYFDVCVQIMVTQQRKDLHMNIPALRKLDAMLIVRNPTMLISLKQEKKLYPMFDINRFLKIYQGYLDNFKGQNEFWYASRDDNDNDNEEGQNRKNQRKDDKWWLPTVKVPEKGLSEISRKWLKHQKELVHQVLKAAMAINAQVLTEMSVPDSYTESLPKVRKQLYIK